MSVIIAFCLLSRLNLGYTNVSSLPRVNEMLFLITYFPSFSKLYIHVYLLFPLDINECLEDPDICDHQCINRRGGYRCTCQTGFRMVDRTRCEGQIYKCNRVVGRGGRKSGERHRNACSNSWLYSQVK